MLGALERQRCVRRLCGRFEKAVVVLETLTWGCLTRCASAANSIGEIESWAVWAPRLDKRDVRAPRSRPLARLCPRLRRHEYWSCMAVSQTKPPL